MQQTVTLLHLESNKSDLRVVASIAESMDIDVRYIPVTSLDNAMESLSEATSDLEQLPDLIISDLHIRGKANLRGVEKILSTAVGNITPLVIFTTIDTDQEVAFARRNRVALVRKPVDFEEFTECVEAILTFHFKIATVLDKDYVIRMLQEE